MAETGGPSQRKGKGKAVLATARLHGKDVKLAAAVREANKELAGSDQESSFDARRIGRKAVFRPVLSSPFNVPLHNITPVQADIILHSLLELLKGEEVRQYFKRENEVSPKTSSRKTKEKNRRRRMRMVLEVLKQHGVDVLPLSNEKTTKVQPTAETAQKKPFLCGLNSITRTLEALIRQDLGSDPSSSETSIHVPKYIFLCEEDVDPSTLVSHLPLLVSTFNAVLKKECMLVRLPVGSEAQLCEAVELRRCSVISIDDTDLAAGSQVKLAMDSLREKMLAAGCKARRLNWLDDAIECFRSGGSGTMGSFPMLDPQVKHFRSSAPLDMNAVKATRKTERAERKTVKRKRKQAAQNMASTSVSHAAKAVQPAKPKNDDFKTMTHAEKVKRIIEQKRKRKSDKAAASPAERLPKRARK